MRVLIISALLLSQASGPVLGASVARAAKKCCCCGNAAECQCGCMTEAPTDPAGKPRTSAPAKLCDCDDLPLNLPSRSVELHESTRVLTSATVAYVTEITGTSISRAIDHHHGPPAPDLHQTGIILLI